MMERSLRHETQYSARLQNLRRRRPRIHLVPDRVYRILRRAFETSTRAVTDAAPPSGREQDGSLDDAVRPGTIRLLAQGGWEYTTVGTRRVLRTNGGPSR